VREESTLLLTLSSTPTLISRFNTDQLSTNTLVEALSPQRRPFTPLFTLNGVNFNTRCCLPQTVRELSCSLKRSLRALNSVLDLPQHFFFIHGEASLLFFHTESPFLPSLPPPGS
jgi:hypothetical protein